MTPSIDDPKGSKVRLPDQIKDSLGFKGVEIVAAFVTVAGSDFLRPAGPYNAWLLVAFGVAWWLGSRWRPLKRFRTVCLVGAVLSLLVFVAQIVKAPRFGPNPGVGGAALPQIVKPAQAVLLPINSADKFMLRLEADLEGTEQEAAKAARTALSASNTDTWRYAAEAIFASQYPRVQRMAFFEVIRRRPGVNLLIETDASSQNTLASVLSDARLELCCGDEERGAFGGNFRNDVGNTGIVGAASDQGVTMEAELPHRTGERTMLLMKLRPNRDSRLVGSATANGQSTGVSIPLL